MKNVYPLPVFLLVLFVWCLPSTNAQTVDFDKVVTPQDSRPKEFEDYLVQLAWNNMPENKALASKVVIAEKEVSLKKREWYEDIQGQLTFNDINVSYYLEREDINNRQDLQFFAAPPVWNVTASMNLGTVLNRKTKIDIEEQKKLIAEHDVNTQKLRVRQMVLERYEKILRAEEFLKIRKQAEDDAYETYVFLKKKFEDGDRDFEEYSRASTAYFNAQEKTVDAESNVQLAVNELEELIGIEYEKALKRRRPKNKK